MSKQSFKVCCCFSRRFKLNVVEAPKEIKTQFDRYSVDGIMSSDNLKRFLIDYQGEDKNLREEDAQLIIDKLKEFKHLNVFHRKGLHLEAFFRYLLSDANPPLLPKVHHDMTAPLSHYFIYTGHNSYLTGNQFSSDCSDVPIIKALRRGVRVIELDLWPNSTKNDVDVLHGWTLTTRVELIKCLRSIKEYAFCASPYPVIITLEAHLTPDLQKKVAKMITQTFGDMLFIPAGEGTKEFLSPKLLMNKILISTKPPKEIQDPKTIKEMEIRARQEKNEGWGEEVPELKACYKSAEDVFIEHLDDDGDLEDDGDNKLQEKPAPEYKAIIAIHGGKHKGGMDEALRVHPDKVRRISMSELKLKKAAETHKSHIVRFTVKNFLRVYPKGSRIDSSNYNPLIGWMHGAQMVALNMQGYGRSLWLMQGLFRANGGCGYVRKPDFLLNTHDPRSEIFHFRDSLPVKKTLKVHLYMGEGWFSDFHHRHFDMCSPPDFYTRIGIAGVRDDSIMKKTKTIEDDWTPVWDEEFEFPLAVPELALLRIEVHESDTTGKDDFGGQTCLPVSELRTGIRSVSLYSRKGDKFKSVKLLMRFEFV